MTAALENQPRNIALVCGGLQQYRLRLQPWHYCMAVASQLQGRGCRVTVISDTAAGGDNAARYGELAVRRLPSISNPRWRSNRRLQQAIETSDPEVILWHTGVSSFLHQGFASSSGCPIIGICTSPIYTRSELARVGWLRLLRSWRLSGIQLLTAFTPAMLLGRTGRRNPQMNVLVVQTKTTKQALMLGPVWEKEIDVIPPAANDFWHQRPNLSRRAAVRKQLGFSPEDDVLVYFGSPAPMRGLHTLVEAFALLQPDHGQLKLLVLSRRNPDDIQQGDSHLRRLVDDMAAEGKIVFISGLLDEGVLRDYVGASDVVTLPFALITSDAPISLLEAQAIGKPVVALDTGCVAEIIGSNHPGLVREYSAGVLANTIANVAANLAEKSGSSLDAQGSRMRRGSQRRWEDVGEEWMQLLSKVI